jgi:hypothetical protein
MGDAGLPLVIVLSTGGTIAGRAGSSLSHEYKAGSRHRCGTRRRGAGAGAGGPRAGRTGEQHRELEHGVRRVAFPRRTHRCVFRRRSRPRGHRHHPWHEHDRGDGVFPQPHGAPRPAGGARRVAATGDGAERGRPAQPVERGARRGQPGLARPRRAGHAQRRDQRGARRRRRRTPIASKRSSRATWASSAMPITTVVYYRRPEKRHTTCSEFALIAVGEYRRWRSSTAVSNRHARVVIDALRGGRRGFVFTGTGAGRLSDVEKDDRARARANAGTGRPVFVRSNRLGNGRVLPHKEYDSTSASFPRTT